MYYQVQGTVVRFAGKPGETVTIQLPTFYLHSDVQGILNVEQAEKVALSIVNPTSDPNIEPHLYVTTVL